MTGYLIQCLEIARLELALLQCKCSVLPAILNPLIIPGVGGIEPPYTALKAVILTTELNPFMNPNLLLPCVNKTRNRC